MDLSPPVLLAAVVPPLLLAWYFRSLPSPRLPLWSTGGRFVLGALSVLLQGFLIGRIESQVASINNPYLNAFATALLTAALPEEGMRFLLVIAAVLLVRRDGGPIQGVVYGGVIAAGFAAAEAVLGTLGGEGMLRVSVGRTLGAVLHCCDGVLIGYFVGLARLRPNRRGLYLLLALAVPVALHTLYDFGVLTEVPGDDEDDLPPWPAAVLMLLVLVVYCVDIIWAVVAIRWSKRLSSRSDSFGIS